MGLKKETKTRTLTKTVMWRVVAVFNSFAILSLAFSKDSLTNAIAMNITGFFVYYLYERIWNKIPYGVVDE